MSSKFKRKQYLTDVSLQARYVLLTFFILLVFLGVAVGIVYFTGWVELVDRLANVYPQGRLIEILRLIYFRLGVGALILFPVAFGLTLFLSHTVAGPLVRIKRYLSLMAKGEFDLAPLVLRPYDEMKDVAELINEMTSKLGDRAQERKKLIQSLESTIEDLRKDVQQLPSAGQEMHRKINYLSETIRILD